jgi:hypothetical protein
MREETFERAQAIMKKLDRLRQCDRYINRFDLQADGTRSNTGLGVQITVSGEYGAYWLDDELLKTGKFLKDLRRDLADAIAALEKEFAELKDEPVQVNEGITRQDVEPPAYLEPGPFGG